MKYNKNLAGVQITDELINRSSSASARLAHDTILANTVVVRTAPAGGGTLLALTTDYTLGSEDARLTTEAGGTVNTTLAIVNGARLNTNLYVSYKTVGDYAEAEDINGIIASVTVSGNYTVGNEQTVNVTAATADITIPSGLPIGTRKTIRKLHATTASSVNILRSGTDVFTSASLTTVPIFGNGSFWIIEKVTSTRWELVGGQDVVYVTSESFYNRSYNGTMVTSNILNLAADSSFSFSRAFLSGTVPMVQLSVATPQGDSDIHLSRCTGVYGNQCGNSSIALRGYSIQSSGVLQRTFADQPTGSLKVTMVAQGRWY